MNEENLEHLKKACVNVGKAIVKAFEPVIEQLKELIDSLEPYQKYEILHPRKKPRGSIRRNKHKRGKHATKCD